MAKFEVVGDITRGEKTFTVLKGARLTVFSKPDDEKKIKDVDQQYFSERTQFGDEYGITRKFLMYDHGKNDLSNELAEFIMPNPVVGAIEITGKDAGQRWVQIELDKANVAYPYILELNNLGVLGLSSRTLDGKGVAEFAPDGEILRWPEVEGSLTVMPADARTRFNDNEVVSIKSLAGRYLTRIEKTAPQVDPVKVEEEKSADLYMSISADLEDGSVSDVVDAALSAVKTTETPVAAFDETAMLALLAGLLETALNPWKAKVEALEKSTAALSVQIEDHKKSIKKVATVLGSTMKDAVAKLSPQERAALNLEPSAKQYQAPLDKSQPLVTSNGRVVLQSAFGDNAPGSK